MTSSIRIALADLARRLIDLIDDHPERGRRVHAEVARMAEAEARAAASAELLSKLQVLARVALPPEVEEPPAALPETVAHVLPSEPAPPSEGCMVCLTLIDRAVGMVGTESVAHRRGFLRWVTLGPVVPTLHGFSLCAFHASLADDSLQVEAHQ